MPEDATTKYLPYELLAEQLAEEATKRTREKYGDDPYVIGAYLPIVLKELAHDCIELGLGLSGFHEEDIAGPAQILEAYNAGVAEGAAEAQDE